MARGKPGAGIVRMPHSKLFERCTPSLPPPLQEGIWGFICQRTLRNILEGFGLVYNRLRLLRVASILVPLNHPRDILGRTLTPPPPRLSGRYISRLQSCCVVVMLVEHIDARRIKCQSLPDTKPDTAHSPAPSNPRHPSVCPEPQCVRYD